MNEIKPINKCRACYSGKLEPILSLGNQYVTNFVRDEKEQEKIPRVPLELVLCGDCKLLQLKHNAPPEAMWGDQYWYKSGINRMIREDLKDVVYKSQQLIKTTTKKDDIIMDIGCNDGTLFSFYNSKERLIGFEPSKNVADEAKRKGYQVIDNFFNAEDFKKRFGNEKAKIITAISMFYDLDNPNKFLEDIVSCLDNDGLFVVQQNYLGTMLENNAFDNICHEHRQYYSLTSLENLLEKHGLEVFDIEQNSINGGSIRTYVKFKNNKKLRSFEGADERIKNLLDKEKRMKLDTLKPYQEFASRINSTKRRLINFLKQEKKLGKKFVG